MKGTHASRWRKKEIRVMNKQTHFTGLSPGHGSWFYIYKFFCLHPLFTFLWAEPGGIDPWCGWLIIVLQCCDTVGWVIWPLKSSLKWPIMCWVRLTIPSPGQPGWASTRRWADLDFPRGKIRVVNSKQVGRVLLMFSCVCWWQVVGELSESWSYIHQLDRLLVSRDKAGL